MPICNTHKKFNFKSTKNPTGNQINLIDTDLGEKTVNYFGNNL